MRSESKNKMSLARDNISQRRFSEPEFEQEHIWQDPKDGELHLSRVKPGETLVEARSDTDVQIVRQT